MEKKTIPFMIPMFVIVAVSFFGTTCIEIQVFCRFMGLFGWWQSGHGLSAYALPFVPFVFLPILIESLYFVAQLVCYVWMKLVLSKLPWEWQWDGTEKFEYKTLYSQILEDLWK